MYKERKKLNKRNNSNCVGDYDSCFNYFSGDIDWSFNW